jgi:hypothetical protein
MQTLLDSRATNERRARDRKARTKVRGPRPDPGAGLETNRLAIRPAKC